jgi:hypothetical protein
MMSVWKEFQKRKREVYQSTEEFFHSATPERDWSPDVRYKLRHPELAQKGGGPPVQVLAAYHALMLRGTLQGQGPDLRLQDLAMVFFLDRAFTLGRQHIRLVPISELRKRRRHYLEMAELLRADAADQEQLGLYEVEWMEEAARAFEKLAGAPEPEPGRSVLVTRQPRGDTRIKGFVMVLGNVTRNVFGSPFYGSLATTANVVFSRDDLTSAAVRKMLPSDTALNRI